MTVENKTSVPPAVRRIFAHVWLPVLLLALWWVLSMGSTSYFFPPLSEILKALYVALTEGRLFSDLIASLTNLFLGLFVAIILGVGIGLLVGENDTVRKICTPLLDFLRSVPPAAIIPLIIVSMGVGVFPKVFIIVIGCIWPVLLNTIDGVRGRSSSVRDTVSAYRIPLHLAIVRVSFMNALPQIMAGIRVSLAIALVLMIISEFFGATKGIGHYLTNASQSFLIKELWGGTLLVGVVGYVLSAAFVWAERYILAWYFQDTAILDRRAKSKSRNG